MQPGWESRYGTMQVIATCTARLKKDIMINRKKMKDNEPTRNIYINDDLTPLRYKLLAYVKKLETLRTEK